MKYSLFLDFDGTLVDFAPTPDGIHVPHDLITLLHQLNQTLEGALALVTGRSVDSLRKHLRGLSINIAGEHGAHFAFGNGEQTQLDVADFSAELNATENLFGNQDGLQVERKAAGFGVHYRRAPRHETAIKDHMSALGKKRADVDILPGNMIVELRSKGVHKGAAIDTFMSNAPFFNRVPIFIGDDTTDEDGFLTVNRLKGISIKVGNGDTVAIKRLPDVAAVHDWLGNFLKEVQQEEK